MSGKIGDCFFCLIFMIVIINYYHWVHHGSPDQIGAFHSADSGHHRCGCQQPVNRIQLGECEPHQCDLLALDWAWILPNNTCFRHGKFRWVSVISYMLEIEPTYQIVWFFGWVALKSQDFVGIFCGCSKHCRNSGDNALPWVSWVDFFPPRQSPIASTWKIQSLFHSSGMIQYSRDLSCRKSWRTNFAAAFLP